MRKALAALALLAAAGCSVSGTTGGAGKTTVVVGYQSKTINTVTAGTLLRSLGYLEKRLGEASTPSSGRTTTPAPPSPPRWSPARSTSARWATTRC